jgi:hypothetical protein
MDFTLPVDQRPNCKGYFTPAHTPCRSKKKIGYSTRGGATFAYINTTV